MSGFFFDAFLCPIVRILHLAVGLFSLWAGICPIAIFKHKNQNRRISTMKKKVYYKLNRYQVTKVEVETAEQEQAVKMLNREMDRFIVALLALIALI